MAAEVLIVAEYQRGASLPDIVKQFGVTQYRARKIVKRAGVLRSRVEGIRVAGAAKRKRKAAFKMGDRVRKKKGSEWQGRIVGTYSTSLTPEGYAVESECHPGSVQIYPVAALERVEETEGNENG